MVASCGVGQHVLPLKPPGRITSGKVCQCANNSTKATNTNTSAVATKSPRNTRNLYVSVSDQTNQPFISVINDAIERTHRLTGMPRSEIVRRALVRKEIPLYGAGGALIAPQAFGPTAE